MTDGRRNERPAEYFRDLSQPTIHFLSELRPDELQLLRSLSRMRTDELQFLQTLLRMSSDEKAAILRLAHLGRDGAEQVFEANKLTSSIRTSSRFLRWAFVGLAGVFVTTAFLADGITRIVTWIGMIGNGAGPR